MTQQKIERIIQENTKLHTKVAVLEEDNAHLREQLAWLKRQVFGRKTEKASVIIDTEQISLFSDEETSESKNNEEKVTVPEHKRKKKRTYDDWMSGLEIEEILHEVTDKICAHCGSEMKVINREKEYDELVYDPGRFHIRRHYAEVVKCPVCGENPDKDAQRPDDIEPCNIIRAEYPHAIIPGSFCSPELMAHIIYEKYAKAVPLNRQEKDFTSKGIHLLRATMSNWVLKGAELWCEPITDKMKEMMVSGLAVHADETVVQVLHEDGRKATAESRMWVYCNGSANEHSIILFDYSPTRKGENANEYLKDFSGYIICDGYQGYNLVEGVKRCGCMVHLRRYFVNALPEDKSLHSTSVAAKVIDYIGNIYHIEKQLADKTTEKRYEERLAREKPLLDALFAYLETVCISGNGNLAKAVTYALNEKKYFYTYLENGDLPLDNNRAELVIRPFTVGRKNWLFSNTARGARASASFYSIISSAQANGLNAEKYLTDLFSHPPGTIILPWN